VVALNMLIAMMSNSFDYISVRKSWMTNIIEQ
jgi:hypothetical protein